MEFAGRLERGKKDLEFSGDFPMYLRAADRQLRNEFNESTRCGAADTYGHTRRAPQRGKYNENDKK